MTGTKMLNIGVVGVGRMGFIHAYNLESLTPRANLVAIADPNVKALNAASKELSDTVKKYEDVEALLRHPGIEAVVIACATSEHARLTIKAIELGLHVLCEKPLSIELSESERVLEVAKTRPDLKLMVAFVRRFDEAYSQAHKRLADIGEPYMIRSANCDKYDESGFFTQFSTHSGTIYLDVGIHDIDMARWLYNKAPIKRVYAHGTSKFHPELKKTNDADNALGIMEFENGKMFTFYFSRTSGAGYECTTEIFGIKGKFVINQNPDANRMTICDHQGVRRESDQTNAQRFKDAFVNEVNAFVSCCNDDSETPLSLDDSFEALKIAKGLAISFKTGKPVDFDKDGYPIALIAIEEEMMWSKYLEPKFKMLCQQD